MMERLNRLQTVVFLLGSVLMVVGVGMYMLGQLNGKPDMVLSAPWVFLVGSLAFALMQILQRYDGPSLTIKRLRRIMVFGDVCFVVSALLMIENVYHFLRPYFTGSIESLNQYTQVTYNNWVLVLFVATMLELYTTHRISSELKKEAKKL